MPPRTVWAAAVWMLIHLQLGFNCQNWHGCGFTPVVCALPLNTFFSLHGYCLHFCNVEWNLITKGKDLNARALLGKDHAGKPFSTLGSPVPHQRPHQHSGAHGCSPLPLAKVWDFCPNCPYRLPVACMMLSHCVHKDQVGKADKNKDVFPRLPFGYVN